MGKDVLSNKSVLCGPIKSYPYSPFTCKPDLLIKDVHPRRIDMGGKVSCSPSSHLSRSLLKDYLLDITYTGLGLKFDLLYFDTTTLK